MADTDPSSLLYNVELAQREVMIWLKSTRLVLPGSGMPNDPSFPGFPLKQPHTSLLYPLQSPILANVGWHKLILFKGSAHILVPVQLT